MCLISSLSSVLSGTDAAPHGVWIVFCYISEICSRTHFLAVLYLSSAHPNLIISQRCFLFLPVQYY